MTETVPTNEFASLRPWPFDSLLLSETSERDWTLSHCWRFSRDTFARTQGSLINLDIDRNIIHSLVVAGSLGRMEAQPHSDCDLLIFINDGVNPDGDPVKTQIDAIWHCLRQQGLRLPKSWGIFAKPASPSELTQPGSLGDLNESRAIFGKRIQLLLDCQPLFEANNFRQLQRQLLQWYATAFVTDNDNSQWRYLINDLVRYYKSYSAWHQFKLDIEHDDSWYIRDSKLRTSRLLMYAGLIFQLGDASNRTHNKVEELLSTLTLTPLERIIDSFSRHGVAPRRCAEFIDHYDTYYRVMADDAARHSMVEHAPTSLSQLPAQRMQGYAKIDDAAEILCAELTEFLLNRRQDWHPLFFRTLLF